MTLGLAVGQCLRPPVAGAKAAGSIAPTSDHVDLADVVHLAIGTLTDLGWRGLSCGPGHTVSPSQTQSLTHQVLIGGIRNVLQRSPPGAPPTVIVGGDSGPPAVLVIDHGPGLPSSWPEVTAAFRHRDHRQPRHGLGLGLALSRGWPRRWPAR